VPHARETSLDTLSNICAYGAIHPLSCGSHTLRACRPRSWSQWPPDAPPDPIDEPRPPSFKRLICSQYPQYPRCPQCLLADTLVRRALAGFVTKQITPPDNSSVDGRAAVTPELEQQLAQHEAMITRIKRLEAELASTKAALAKEKKARRDDIALRQAAVAAQTAAVAAQQAAVAAQKAAVVAQQAAVAAQEAAVAAQRAYEARLAKYERAERVGDDDNDSTGASID